MKAIAVYPGKKDSLHLRTIRKPRINKDQVLVKSLYAGVCGTDIEINQGLYGTAPKGEDYLILGHESVGIVEKVGNNVSKLKEGDYVVRTVRRPCNDKECLNCKNDSNDMCITGNYVESGIKKLHGVMAEYFIDSPEFLLTVPEEYKEVAVLLEPLSVVEKATREAFLIQNRLNWNPQKALVVGAGSIGLLEAMTLRNKGLETFVFAKSLKGNLKSKIVKEMGAEYISSQEKTLFELKEEIGNIDLIVEASGNSEMVFQAMDILGNNGVLALTSVTPDNNKLIIPSDKINFNFVLGNKTLFGSVNANYFDYIKGVQEFIAFNNKWPNLIEKLITKKVELKDFKEAFIKERDDIKSVIKF